LCWQSTCIHIEPHAYIYTLNTLTQQMRKKCLCQGAAYYLYTPLHTICTGDAGDAAAGQGAFPTLAIWNLCQVGVVSADGMWTAQRLGSGHL
jgi:hypothetical protein